MTENFSSDEFECHCGCKGPVKIDTEFVDKLQAIRTHIGKPMYVSSGVRCPDFNKMVGGVDASYHLQGLAADILCSNGALRAKIIKKALSIGLSVGVNKFFIHLDNRYGQVVFGY